jgi:C-terminal processing protease CtpA/Prc
MFILMLKDTGRAVTIGETTGGGSGNPEYIPLTIGGVPLELCVATWRMQRLNGEELEGTGIAPDIDVPSSSGTDSSDMALSRAIEYLK